MTQDDSDLPDFTPVPNQRLRHDGWTPERQRGFIQHLGRFGGVAAAARSVGKTGRSAYQLRAKPGAESFAAAWDVALAMGRDRAFETAMERGLNGYTVPVRRKGRVVGHRHHFDNRLLYAACYATPMGKDLPR